MYLAMRLIAGALCVCFVVQTAWGWRKISPERRFPASVGVPPSIEGTVGKRTGMFIWLFIGLLFSALTLFAASREDAMGWIGVGLLAFFLAMERHTIKRLSR